MGYWDMGEGGASFVEGEDPADQMIWGDEPADIMDEALARIKVAFIRDVGRMPSQQEVINGLKFTTNVLDELAPEPKDAPVATRGQISAASQHGYAAFGKSRKTTPWELEAQGEIAKLLKELEIEHPAPADENGEQGG